MKAKSRNKSELIHSGEYRSTSKPGNLVNRILIKVTLLLIFLGSGVACDAPLMMSEDPAITPGLNGTDALSSGASLPHTNATKLDMPMSISYELTTYDCANNPGPQIYFNGLAGTIGFGVRTIFRNNEKGTHENTDETHVDVALQPDGSTITIPKQPVLGGTGGNPFI